MKISINIVNEAGEITTVEVASVFEVCSRCRGKGTHVNPAIDGEGLSAEDLQDDEFRNSYLDGTFDIACDACMGLRVLEVPDYSRFSDSMMTGLRKYHDLQRYENSEY